MKRFPSLGLFLASTALIGTVGRRPPPKPKQPRHTGKKTQADIDALDRAVAKRARKAAKLREHGL